MLGIVREGVYPGVEAQKEAVRRYAERAFPGARLELLLVRHYESTSIHVVLGREARRRGARVAVALDLARIALSCRRLIASLAALFKAGVEEVHTVDGIVITRGEFEEHKPFLAKLAVGQRTLRGTWGLETLRRVLEAVPLTREEARAIWSLIARETEIELPVASKTIVEAGVREKELLEGEDGERIDGRIHAFRATRLLEESKRRKQG